MTYFRAIDRHLLGGDNDGRDASLRPESAQCITVVSFRR